jgi:hypothetical protein
MPESWLLGRGRDLADAATMTYAMQRGSSFYTRPTAAPCSIDVRHRLAARVCLGTETALQSNAGA